MEMRQEMRGLCCAFMEGLDGILGASLYAVYVYGALTFPETEYTGDVDFHAILSAAPSEPERTALLALHDLLAREFPPLGAELDGYYLLLEDAQGSAPPRHLLFPHLVDDSWALHRAHILAGRCIVLHGPDPTTVYVAPTWSEVSQALDGELDYVAHHLEQYPDYCVLNLCRLVYSWEAGDVVTSKAAAAAWASRRFPAWKPLIDLALKSYAKQTSAADRVILLAGAADLYPIATHEIDAARARRSP
jgi:hypothetical protein